MQPSTRYTREVSRGFTLHFGPQSSCHLIFFGKPLNIIVTLIRTILLLKLVCQQVLIVCFLKQNMWEDGRGVTLEVAKELPELLDRNRPADTQANGYYTNNYRSRSNPRLQRGGRGTWEDKPFKRKESGSRDQWRSKNGFRLSNQ